jgi:hypothetical protein
MTAEELTGLARPTEGEPFVFAWHSARRARHLGFDVYRRDGPSGEEFIHATAVTADPRVYRDWGDEVFAGCVQKGGLVRHCYPGTADRGEDWGRGETAPLAICRAALLEVLRDGESKTA